MAEMLATTGSSEIVEWIAELSLRSQEESEAIDKAKAGQAQPRTFGG